MLISEINFSIHNIFPRPPKIILPNFKQHLCRGAIYVHSKIVDILVLGKIADIVRWLRNRIMYAR